ncbi:MAG TPA: GtrA family protein [Phenylobacterium sp.]|nr:GtrA family protein [Phenylobacterium sp.]
MEEAAVPPRPRRRLLAKFTGAALVGFAFSALTLHLGLHAGLRGWAARLIALLVAMHVTFFINGRFTFKALTRDRFLPLWGAYVANSSVGNCCNYLVFLALRSTHRPVISNTDVAFLAGAVTAWAINFLGARFLVFGAPGRRLAAGFKRMAVSRLSDFRPSRPRPSHPDAPAPAEHGSSRR